MSLRWMNSIAPMSTPRVGWETRRSFGLSSNSRPMISFCWLPPESDFADSYGIGGRTSKFSTISLMRLSIAVSFKKPPVETGGR